MAVPHGPAHSAGARSREAGLSLEGRCGELSGGTCGDPPEDSPLHAESRTVSRRLRGKCPSLKHVSSGSAADGATGLHGDTCWEPLKHGGCGGRVFFVRLMQAPSLWPAGGAPLRGRRSWAAQFVGCSLGPSAQEPQVVHPHERAWPCDPSGL